jgi:hypothetical protein
MTPPLSESDLCALFHMSAAAEDDAEACLDASAESHNGDEFSHVAPPTPPPADLTAQFAVLVNDALTALVDTGRVDVDWSVRAFRLIADYNRTGA